jgi:hypothetical protein
VDRPCSRGRWALGVRHFASLPLCELFCVLAPHLWLDADLGRRVRRRLFTPARTFWLFLSQAFAADRSCREAVRRALAWLGTIEGRQASAGTSGYCRARARLPLAWLAAIGQRLVERVEQMAPEAWLWHGRRVIVADGSTVHLADTPQNQALYPQSSQQAKGCGFPLVRIVGLFSLATGLMVALGRASLHTHERVIFARLWREHLVPGDVVLADRGFCGFAEFFELAKAGIDAVMRRHHRLGPGLRVIRRLGPGDRLLLWMRSSVPSAGYDRETWNALPTAMAVREITVRAVARGFRTKSIVLLTTLLDAHALAAREFADLYRRRWEAELCLRHIKSTLGMGELRAKTPAMADRELAIYQIAHNLVRAVMAEAALRHEVPVERLSFKGTLATLRTWAPIFALDRGNTRDLQRRMLECIAGDLVPVRPGRHEPRAIKRRRNKYALLNAPRHQFREIPHRNRHTRAE